VRWHRQDFRLYWRWKSRGPKPGRPPIDAALRKLIREMQADNIGWGAPRIHGELLKLGVEVSQATVSKYLVHSKKPPSQTWRTFLSNHAECLAAMDFFTVPTARFRVLYVFIVLSHDRRQVVHFNVSEQPTARWTVQQLVEIFPFESAPRYLLRHRDAIYGDLVQRRIRGAGDR
jgi:putative transposase